MYQKLFAVVKEVGLSFQSSVKVYSSPILQQWHFTDASCSVSEEERSASAASTGRTK